MQNFNNSLYGTSALAKGISQLMHSYPLLTLALFIIAIVCIIALLVYLKRLTGKILAHFTGNNFTIAPVDSHAGIDHDKLTQYDLNHGKSYRPDQTKNFITWDKNYHAKRLKNLTPKN